MNPAAGKPRPLAVRLFLLSALAMASMAADRTGCEDSEVGLPCDVGSKADPKQIEYNDQALECPSRICLKPAVDPGANLPATATAALCSAPCTQDSDCDGQLRDNTNPSDQRCVKGFACGVAFVKGRMACQRLCICRDFLGPGGAATPPGC